MSADGGCVRETHATFQSDGASGGASDVLAFSAQRKSSQPMIDINHPPSALYDSTSQDSSQAPATPAASDGSKPVVSHGVNMFFVRDGVADASHGLATATAARTHPAPVPAHAVSGPRSPAPRSTLPHSLRHKAASRMSGPYAINDSTVANASGLHEPHSHQQQRQMHDRHEQQMQQLYQQKHARKSACVPEMAQEKVTDDDESPDRWDSSEGDEGAAMQSNGIAKTCAHCGTSKTPLWRNGPPGPKSLCNACGIRFNKIRSGKRKASPQEAAMLREYDSTDPAFSKPLPQSPVHKARSRLPRPRAGLFVYAPSSCCEGLPSAATSSNSDCGSPAGEGPEEGEVCDEPMHVGKKVCLRHEEQHLGNKMDEDDVVLGAELLVSLFGSCPVGAISEFSAHAASDVIAENSILAVRRATPVRFDEPTEADAKSESTKPPAINDKPLIGILSQPGDGDGGKAPRVNLNQAVDMPYDEGSYGGAEVGRHRAVDTNVSYIAASYAKWVESAGARPVPLLYDEPVEVLRQKFDMINGLLIPGGGTDLVPGPFMSTVQLLLQWAKEANDRGDYFPVQATCMGFEAMAIVLSEVCL
ncbi:unnamed protein product [Closterium sp. NIES-53]